MDNHWILHVEGIGKIRSADLTMAPVMVFIGDNNSGKSYLMALLYTLLNARFYKHNYDLCMDTDEYRFCAEWMIDGIKVARKENRYEKVFDDEAQKKFGALLNKVLQQNLARISQRTFNKEIPIQGMYIVWPEYPKMIKIEFSCEESEEGEPSVCSIRPFWENEEHYTRARTRKLADSMRIKDVRFFVSFLMEFLLKVDFKTNTIQDALFLPSSRTGFLLTYDKVVGKLISEAYDEDDWREGGQLTRPCSDFLKNLADLSPQTVVENYSSILSFMEDSMILGKINISKHAPLPAFSYRPNGGKDMPLFLASGVITELAPLMLLLKYFNHPVQTLFLEEPETGLHPQLQQKMAQVIIRIVNLGIRVFVTTHSDTILQHINNMVKLNNCPSDKQDSLCTQYGYTKNDLITGEHIGLYQFEADSESQSSNIIKLSCNQYGFEIPSFNKTLRKILKESREFECDEESDEEIWKHGGSICTTVEY